MSCNKLDIDWFAGTGMLFAEAMIIRTEVFVIEQKVPLEHERDHIDEISIHALLRVNDQYIATGRVYFADNTQEVARLGRIAVLKSWRGHGYGLGLTKALITIADEHMGVKRVSLHSQVPAKTFYQKLGFRELRKEFLEAGIVHVEMELKLRQL